MKKSSLAAVLLTFSSITFAVSDMGERQITSFGIQTGGPSTVGYLTVTPPVSTNCLYGVMYIYNATDPIPKLFFATALAAYSSGKPAKRIDYDVRPDGTCSITLINF
jgi:hypothetical protein